MAVPPLSPVVVACGALAEPVGGTAVSGVEVPPKIGSWGSVGNFGEIVADPPFAPWGGVPFGVVVGVVVATEGAPMLLSGFSVMWNPP